MIFTKFSKSEKSLSALLLFFICILVPNSIHAKNMEIQSLTEILSEPMDAKTLVLWDIHYTLVEPEPFELWYGSYELFKKELDDNFLLPWISKGLRQPFLDYLTLSVNLKLIDKDSNDVLERIKKTGARQIAVTKMKPGALGNFESSASRTLEQLKPLGLNVLTGNETISSHKQYERRGNIMFVRHSGKAEAIIELMQHKGCCDFSKILVIDDSASELDALRNMADGKDMQINTYLYSGKKNSKPKDDVTWAQVRDLWTGHSKKAEEALSLRN
ncbi:MAG: DUF2608 domain-containing protein [Deltaproteobacteria bacterium]|nr:DUF2608 domain-containing protein [Deltaproteobacteria bacterium]